MYNCTHRHIVVIFSLIYEIYQIHQSLTSSMCPILSEKQILFVSYLIYIIISDLASLQFSALSFLSLPNEICLKAFYLPLIYISTNQNMQLIHSHLIRIKWTTGNGILMSSSHWPIYRKMILLFSISDLIQCQCTSLRRVLTSRSRGSSVAGPPCRG